MHSASCSGSAMPKASAPNWWCWVYRPFCRAFVAEIRTEVETPFARAPWSARTVFDHRPHDTGGAFGAKGERSAAAVVEGVGFFADDVGGFTHAAVKQFGVFEDRACGFL